MIRDFEMQDMVALRAIHEANGLPESCFPNLVMKIGEEEVQNPLYLVRAVMEQDGVPVMASFLKGTAEVYVIVDHNQGTPEQRWEWMKEFSEYVKHEAWKRGLEQISCWVPREIEESFEKRLEALGYVRSPWSCYTLPLGD
jgi:hypothetical protein